MAETRRTRRQISVMIANQPGTLSGVTDALAAAGVNIEGMTVFEGQAHLLLDDPDRGAEALRDARYPVRERVVLYLDLDHRPGSLALAARRLAGAGVNVDYAYSGSSSDPARARVALAVSDVEKAEPLFRG